MCVVFEREKKKKKEWRARSEPAKRKEIVRMSGGGLNGVVGEHMESQKKKNLTFFYLKLGHYCITQGVSKSLDCSHHTFVHVGIFT